MSMRFKTIWNKLIGKPMPHWGWDKEKTLCIIREPKFEEAGKVHDWRNYISSELQDTWDGLSDTTKLIAYFMAEEQANREEWG